MLTLVPPTPIVGVNEVIVGAELAATVNELELESEPPGAVTLISPVVAPPGTVTTSWVVVALETVAEVPLNVTVFDAGVAEKPVPLIVIVVPTGPVAGTKEMTVTVVEANRPIDRTFPTAS
jgi:hypothetical protein